MARRPRIKANCRKENYHVVTRVRGREFLLDEHMKKYFIYALGKLRRLFYVNYAHFCCLSNHYHILLGMGHPDEIDPQEAMQRWNDYHTELYQRNESVVAEREYVVGKLTDISAFMKRLNMLLTIKHNISNGDKGTLWERRFRSIIVKRGWTSIKVGAYIDLNGFRASLTSKPEDYKYSSLNHLKRGNPMGLVDTDQIEYGIKRSRLYSQGLHGADGAAGVEGAGTLSRQAKALNDDEAVAKGEGEINESSGSSLRRIYRIYLAIVYKFGTKAHRDEHGLPEDGGIVVTEEMKESLQRRGICFNPGEQGSLGEYLREYTMGKFIGSTRQETEDFYSRHIQAQAVCSSEKEEKTEDKQSGQEQSGELERWVHRLGPGQWSVCSRRSRGSPD